MLLLLLLPLTVSGHGNMVWPPVWWDVGGQVLLYDDVDHDHDDVDDLDRRHDEHDRDYNYLQLQKPGLVGYRWEGLFLW